MAGTLSGIVGFGSSIMLMPALVIAFGPLQAVPIMAIAAILANLARIVVWWRDVDWRSVAAYSVTGAPAAALGAATLLVLPARFIEAALGVFFIAMIGVRRWIGEHFRDLLERGGRIRFLTGDYLDVTEPEALLELLTDTPIELEYLVMAAVEKWKISDDTAKRLILLAANTGVIEKVGPFGYRAGRPS